MYSCNRNSYLQGNFKQINPQLLNRCVQAAWTGIKNTDEHDIHPPLNRLASEQPRIPVKNIDITRRPLGYGRWAIPKLRRELHSKDIKIVLAAITSLSDLVHDPEKCYQVIKLRVVDRLLDLVTHELPSIRERTIWTLKVIAGHALGREAIVSNIILLHNLLDCLDDDMPEVRLALAACLEMIARFWKTADSLVDMGFVSALLSSLNDKQIHVVEFHLDTLNSLLYCDGKKIALHENGFQMLLDLLASSESGILAKACKVLTRLCTLKQGRKLARQNKILPLLNKLLHSEIEQVYSAACETIMFCTVMSSEKIEASKIQGMAKRLIALAKSRFNVNTQMYAIKALTLICEHPAIKKEVSQNYYQDVNAIQLNDDVPDIRRHKQILMQMIQWMPEKLE